MLYVFQLVSVCLIFFVSFDGRSISSHEVVESQLAATTIIAESVSVVMGPGASFSLVP